VITLQVSQTRLIIDWITSLGWDITQELGYPLFPGPQILDEPDRSVWITGGGGPGYLTDEGGIDASQFQVRVRGPQDDAFEPESVAQLLDSMVLRASFPAFIDGVNINVVYRATNGPTPLPVDPADLRHEFTCNYIFVTGSQ
jgi:hypothetical protein